MDSSEDDYEFKSLERRYSILEAYNQMVTQDMQEMVPHFKPLGSMIRMQNAIELVSFQFEFFPDIQRFILVF